MDPSFEMMLPPNWIKVRSESVDVYVNELTGERTSEHPYHRFLRKFTQTPLPHRTSSPSSSSSRSHSRSQPHTQSQSQSQQQDDDLRQEGGASPTTRQSVGFDTQLTKEEREREQEGWFEPNTDSPLGLNEFFNTRTDSNFPDLTSVKEVYYEYHCQWSERDLNGDISMYGLSIRYQKNGTTMIKFDGIDATWTYTALKGPYGCLEMHDLFIGAKIVLFGRHLTISAANSAACKWIGKEKKRLEKQQEEFTRKIESIGETPCVKRKLTLSVKSITRQGKLDEQTNLRLLLKENARLGEQLANLGLAQKI